MRVTITIDPRDPHAGSVRDDAESWLRHRARGDWRVREDDHSDGCEVLTFEFADPLDAADFYTRTAAAEHRGALG